MYLTLADFRRRIKDEHLRQILGITIDNGGQIEDNPEWLQSIEEAVSEMKSYLVQRYDVYDIFSAQGAARHPLLVMYGTDIAIYHLHCRVSPETITVRDERYTRAMKWLGEVRDGLLDPELPAAPAATSATPFKGGLNDYTNNRL